MYNSNRAKDVKLEKSVADFLDKNFYSKESIRTGISFDRITDKNMQMKGVDVDFGGIKIDEKVKILNGMLNTILQYPSVEISFINRAGFEQCGWFVDKDKITDYYLFIAVFADISDPYELTESKIDKLNLFFVRKSEIYSYLRDKNCNILEESIKLRKDENEIRKDFPCREFHLKKSVSFAEQPINLVLRRYVLEKFKSTKELEVSRSEILKIR